MRKYQSRKSDRRAAFDETLQSYSTLSVAALATGAAVIGATTTASAQTVTPITISGSVSITSLGNTPGAPRTEVRIFLISGYLARRESTSQ